TVRSGFDVADHRVQQIRVPQPPAKAASDQIIPPVETGPVLVRKSSSAITGFRSLGGREQHSFG
ncbi:hypothetical protein, partial [Salmonella enterica]|uniref:hypothetical protein n=1 Tax=Salmonella enterica TaxID=28901 RepID=UPI0032E50F91